MTTSNPLIARFAGQPALVEPSQAMRFESHLHAVSGHPNGPAMIAGEYMQGEDFWGEDGGWCRPYVVADGILQIPVKGVLLNNFPYNLYDYATGYEYIWEAFKRGCADFAIGSIKGIALVCDTPGGMVAGCFDTRDKMAALKQQTGVPVWGFAHESAYSAGYAIISLADQITVSRTGGVGSIGVVTGHLDVSGAMEQAGLKFTYIASDPSKVEGNPYEPLSADAKARIQARIDELYGIFAAAVAGSRPVTEDALRTEIKAYCYTATQAVSNGLADKIGSLEDMTAAFAACLDEPSENEGEDEMAEAKSAVDQAAIDNARADSYAMGLKDGAGAERTRISAILSSDEATDRATLANHLAMNTDMSVDAAKGILAAAPAAVVAPVAAAPAAPVAASPFVTAMNETPNPAVGAGADAATSPAQNKDDASEVRALIAAAGLSGFASLAH